MTDTTPDASRHGAVPVQIRQDRTGKAFIAIDSLVDLFESIRSTLDGDSDLIEGQRRILELLVTRFRPASSYAEIEALVSSDDVPVVARVCRCGGHVVDVRTIDGQRFPVSAKEDPGGEWTPIRYTDGVPVVTAHQGSLGSGVTRLAAHTCEATQ